MALLAVKFGPGVLLNTPEMFSYLVTEFRVRDFMLRQKSLAKRFSVIPTLSEIILYQLTQIE